MIDVSVRGMQLKLETGENLESPVTFHAILGEGEPQFTIEGEAEIVRESDEGHLGLYLLKIDIDGLTHLRRLVELNLGDSDQAVEEVSKW